MFKKLQHLPQWVTWIDTRQKRLFSYLDICLDNIKNSSTIGTTSSSSDDIDSFTGNWQPYSTSLYSKTWLIYNTKTNAREKNLLKTTVDK